MHLKTHTYDAFRGHTRTYLEPAIVHKWNEEQNLQRDYLKQNSNVILGGDSIGAHFNLDLSYYLNSDALHKAV